ncbi:SDR family oxidoreductase [Nocardioides marmoriginsengisoli]|uniref:SDR family oxidoreductase n=1 Tax=Nocardioides marmoriginsengisoli TaxID=661483 RepID=A0A3N0CGC8_9ACTN|nr:SDR family oxidoreductase [Nocardioides marmoriginsengisoli]RNL62495.1 SDR family oxidoreductase [Nocardioides marmoriginsengisoli]
MSAEVALVTGGSRGIGRAVVAEAARRGYTVVFSHRGRADDVAATVAAAEAARAGSRVVGVVASMEDRADLDRLAEAARAEGEVHLLITCAGFLVNTPLADVTDEHWWASLDVHVTAPMLLARALAPDLARVNGAIVNVSSDGGVAGSVHGTPYGTSKAATIGLGHTLARELAPHVRVNTLAPGPIATDMWAAVPESSRRAVEDATPLGRVGTPEEIARAALDLGSWTYVTGQTLVVNGGRVMK